MMESEQSLPPQSCMLMTDPRGSMSREERDEFVPCYLASFRQSDLFHLPYYRAISRFKNMGGPRYMLISSWNFPLFSVVRFLFVTSQNQEWQCRVKPYLRQ